MTIIVSGIIHGRRIDLDQEARLPDGVPVVVHIEPQEISLQERHGLVAATAGAWAGDSSLDKLFEEIAQSRGSDAGRTVSFDDPS